ncbi:DUF2846 domain-containing protein [Bordetella sp. LUAb4]|uniref:DUF2846 domain-containing protein n=1 Tax=Bordetella sp. LUAb4 TaxID=2843195 RepID=UPI001E63AB85|nr:DUF2846 domain-containing protein [Bordetella sp. LUAb4]
MPRGIRIVLLLCAASLLAACAGPRYAEVARNTQLKPGEGRIYLFPTTSNCAFVMQPKLRVNNEIVGRVKPNVFYYVDRPPGNYIITDKYWTGDGASFALAAGETRYVAYHFPTMGSSGCGKPSFHFVESSAEAERLLLPMTYGGTSR